MLSTPEALIESFLQAFRQAYPGKDEPRLTFSDGWFRHKYKGEHEGKMRAEDVEERRRKLLDVISAREYDLTTVAGIASASEQASRAARALLSAGLRQRISACRTIEDLRALKNEVCLECVDGDGFLVPIPAEFDMAFMMHMSEIRIRA